MCVICDIFYIQPYGEIIGSMKWKINEWMNEFKYQRLYFFLMQECVNFDDKTWSYMPVYDDITVIYHFLTAIIFKFTKERK
jgi:hypothetical protein